jgi:hypothetical protein
VIQRQALSRQPYIIESDGHWGILNFESFADDDTFIANVFGEIAHGRFDSTGNRFSFAASGRIWSGNLPQGNDAGNLVGNLLILDTANPPARILHMGDWRAGHWFNAQFLSFHGQMIANDAPHDADLMCNLLPDAPNQFHRKLFQLQPHRDGTVSLFSANIGRYVCADEGGGARVTVDRLAANIWEKFRIHNRGDNKIGFQCALSGHFLTAEYAEDISQRKIVAGGHGRVPDSMNAWETFTILEESLFLT